MQSRDDIFRKKGWKLRKYIIRSKLHQNWKGQSNKVNFITLEKALQNWLLASSWSLTTLRYRAVVTGGQGGNWPPTPQILAAMLTLFQSEGGRLCPPYYCCPFQIFRSSYGPITSRQAVVGGDFCINSSVAWAHIPCMQFWHIGVELFYYLYSFRKVDFFCSVHSMF